MSMPTGARLLETIIVLAMTRSLYRSAPLAAALALTLTGALAACGSDQSAPSPSSSTAAAAGASTTSSEPCPTAPVDVVVSVDQWGDIVSELGGACAKVKTILAGSSVDPHDYEPSPADAASFAGAKMVVVNGADYDAWASKLAESSAAAAPVVSASEVTKTADGANPHLWYSPTAVTAVADAVTAELSKLDPQAASYFGERREALTTTLKPYDDLIAKIKAGASGKSYAATEGIFDYQAEAMGLVNKTPEGYQRASANESDPSPADIAAFTTALTDKQVDVLIYNTQTEGSIPEQIRTAAEQAGVPVVDVTETVPPGQTSFEAWQDGQLTDLAKALGVST